MAKGFEAIKNIASPNLLMKDLQQRFKGDANARISLKTYPDTVQQMAKLFLSGNKMKPFSRRPAQFPSFDNSQAYDVSAAICSAKLHNSKFAHVPVGRKIGFTNKTIWEKYKVDRSNWGYMWHNTVIHNPVELPSLRLEMGDKSIRSKIEPEIVFGLLSAPSSSMSDKELLRCIRWAAHGFEIVHSPFPYWNFTLADTTAVQALHRKLFIGSLTLNQHWHGQEDKLVRDLQEFEIDLYRDDNLIATGRGNNVLGSPLNALRHLCEILESQVLHPRLHPGEIISTGTLTDAIDLDCDGKWHTVPRGLDLLGGEARLSVNVGSHTVRKVALLQGHRSSEEAPSFRIRHHLSG